MLKLGKTYRKCVLGMITQCIHKCVHVHMYGVHVHVPFVLYTCTCTYIHVHTPMYFVHIHVQKCIHVQGFFFRKKKSSQMFHNLIFWIVKEREFWITFYIFLKLLSHFIRKLWRKLIERNTEKQILLNWLYQIKIW